MYTCLSLSTGSIHYRWPRALERGHSNCTVKKQTRHNHIPSNSLVTSRTEVLSFYNFSHVGFFWLRIHKSCWFWIAWGWLDRSLRTALTSFPLVSFFHSLLRPLNFSCTSNFFLEWKAMPGDTVLRHFALSMEMTRSLLTGCEGHLSGRIVLGLLKSAQESSCHVSSLAHSRKIRLALECHLFGGLKFHWTDKE